MVNVHYASTRPAKVCIETTNLFNLETQTSGIASGINYYGTQITNFKLAECNGTSTKREKGEGPND